MASKTTKARPLGNAMSAIASLLLFLTPLRPAGAEILYAETAPMSFEVWAADLAPGFVLQQKQINDRLCYCKNPQSTYASSSSFITMSTAPPLTSSGQPDSSFDFVLFSAGVFGEPIQQTVKPISNPATNMTTRKACGDCNMEVTIDDTNFENLYDWTSPGWNQGQDYPDGCTCTLKVNVRLSQWGYFVYQFAPGSNIKALNNCAHDRMEVDLNGDRDIWCDNNMSQFSGARYTYGVPEDYTFTFISDPNDGNQVETGFKLSIQVYFFGRK